MTSKTVPSQLGHLRKRGLGVSVLDAARARIAWTFDTFPRITVSASGGKDSTVMLHLVMEEAMRRQCRVGVLFIDWEAQYKLTIDHVAALFDRYRDHIEPYWVALPLLTTNACSHFEPEWSCWQPDRREVWVRKPPAQAITDSGAFPFYYPGITFEEFVPAFGHWYAQGQLAACFVGIRAQESLNRWRTIAGHGTKWRDDDGTERRWTNYLSQTLWNIYPIYDWVVEDLWTYHAQTGLPHNPLYDRMHQAGLTLHQMRICEPYGDEQRKGLWLYQVIEPETWGRVVARVAGANTGALYANEIGNIMGNVRISRPAHLTWRQFAEMLLDSMPPKTADHYRDKIAVWLHWYYSRLGYSEETFPDELPDDCGAQDKPSWRRVCKTLLKGDYWCSALCFSPTKGSSYARYRALMQKRRWTWGILPHDTPPPVAPAGESTS